MIDFPASPTPGQRFTAAGATWMWDGAKWLPEGLAPTVAPGINDNRIINGDMRIDQRGVASAGNGTATGYTIDRWGFASSHDGKLTWAKGPLTSANIGFTGFGYNLYFNTASAYTPTAAEFFQLYQIIEADMISDLAWGTPQAKPITLSFVVTAGTSATFGGCITNGDGSRSYPFTFPVTTAWSKVVVTIPGDTSGTWTLQGNGAGLVLHFDLGCGSTQRGPANAWASANYIGVTGTASLVSTSGGAFDLTGVKLEIGSVATPYNRQSLAKSMADCQRYYQVIQILMSSVVAGSGAFGYAPTYNTLMRAAPTATPVGVSYTNASGLNINPSTESTQVWASAAASGYASYIAGILLSAEL